MCLDSLLLDIIIPWHLCGTNVTWHKCYMPSPLGSQFSITITIVAIIDILGIVFDLGDQPSQIFWTVLYMNPVSLGCLLLGHLLSCNLCFKFSTCTVCISRGAVFWQVALTRLGVTCPIPLRLPQH